MCSSDLLAKPVNFFYKSPEGAGLFHRSRSLRGFVEEIYRLCENRGSFEYGLRQPNAEGVVNLIPDIGKMKRVTGWTPEIHFEQGILNILRKL